MNDLLTRRLAFRDAVSDEDRAVIERLASTVQALPAGVDVIGEGVHQSASRILIEGWVCRYKTRASGGRQINQLHVPGDFFDLHSFLLKRLDHSIATLTPCRIAVVPHETLRAVTEEHPHLSRLLWLSTALDSANTREWMTVMGRTSAVSQVAHIFCELYLRLEVVGLAADHRYALPISQQDVADARGLTGVHVNRMLRQLREMGLVEWTRGQVTIHDWDELTRVAEFDPTYLNLWREPR